MTPAVLLQEGTWAWTTPLLAHSFLQAQAGSPCPSSLRMATQQEAWAATPFSYSKAF